MVTYFAFDLTEKNKNMEEIIEDKPIILEPSAIQC